MESKFRLICVCAVALFAKNAFAIPIAWDAGNANWFTQTNWIPAQVPNNVDDASINNTGTANANASVQVNTLGLGYADGINNAAGSANITIGNLTGSSTLSVGRTVNNINTGTGNGTLNVAGNLSGFGVNGVGLNGFGNTGNATGNLTVGGTFDGGLLQIGTASGSGDADGSVEIGNGINSVGLVAVGLNGSSASSGTPTVSGELNVLAGGIQGTGSDMRIGTNGAAGTATGTVTVNGGVSNFEDVEVGLTLLSSSSGTTGPATGSFNIQTGDLAGDGTGSLMVGRTANNGITGNADGVLSVAGNLSGFGVNVVGLNGFGNAGNATGNLTVGGTFDGGLLQIGTASGSGDADGSVEIGNGINSVGLVAVGLNGSSASSGTPTVSGELNVLAGGIQGTGSDMRIGTNGAAGTATGTVTVNGGVSNFEDVEVGLTLLSSSSGTTGPATGSFNIQTGDLAGDGTGSLMVGRTANNGITGNADGVLSVAGNLSGFGVNVVGLNGFGNAGNATGNLTVGGTFDGGLLQIGTASGSGDADGSVEIGNGINSVGLVAVGLSGSSASSGTPTVSGELNVLAGGIQGTGSDMRIGTNGAAGTATGTVTVNGGVSNFEDVEVGLTGFEASAGPAIGALTLINGGLSADNLSVGVTEAPSSATATGILDINDNAIEIAKNLILGDGSNIMLDINNLTDFGHFDIFGQGTLNGVLDLNFGFMPIVGDIFDFFVSDSIDGLLGGFDLVNFEGLAAGTLVSYDTILNENNHEVWRLMIGEGDPNPGVPLPGSLFLLAAGLAALLVVRRGTRLRE